MTVENSHLSELNISQGNGTKLKSNLSVKSVNTEKSVNSVGLTRLRLIKIILQNKNRPNLFHNTTYHPAYNTNTTLFMAMLVIKSCCELGSLLFRLTHLCLPNLNTTQLKPQVVKERHECSYQLNAGTTTCFHLLCPYIFHVSTARLPFNAFQR